MAPFLFDLQAACTAYGVHTETRKCCSGCCCGDARKLNQAQLAGACDRFGAPLDLEFAENLAIVSFDRVQGEEEPLSDFMIRESVSNKAKDF
jgi:hypothetical protein